MNENEEYDYLVNDILVVDDTVENLELLEQILSNAGFQVRAADSGELALLSINAKLPGLVLLDIKLPGIDGYEVCRRLKSDKRASSIPVIFISVMGSEQERTKGFKIGGVDYISKPFYAEEVIARVNTHITLRRVQLDLEKRNAELIVARDILEIRVKERTTELEQANHMLQKQIWENQLTYKKLQESELRYRLILDTANEGIWMVDNDIKTTFVNSRLLDMLGYTKEEMINETLDTFIFDDELSDHLKKMENRKKGISERYERCWKGKGNRNVCTITSATPLIDSENNIYGAFAMVSDITDRKKAESERENLINQLKDKNSELESFSYTVSHDLKNPLNTIKGFATLIQKELANNDISQITDHAEHVINTSNKMNFLLEDLLRLSKIGHTVGAPVNVSLLEITKETVELLSNPIAESKVDIEIEPDLPIVYVDRSRFIQVMENLISNAIKFMGDQKNPKITIGSKQEGNETICYVSDNGKGIDPKHKDMIFNLFEKIDQKITGTGIGLSIVKKIIEIYGGHIWVESEGIEMGTTIYFTVPVSNHS